MLYSSYDLQVPGVLEARSLGTLQSPKCCLVMKKTQGLGQSRRQKEIGEEVNRILLWSIHPFSGLKHIFLQFKKKRKTRDLFCLPLLFLKSQALSHRSTELSNIHWSGKKRFSILQVLISETPLEWIFQGNGCHLSNYITRHKFPWCVQHTLLSLE